MHSSNSVILSEVVMRKAQDNAVEGPHVCGKWQWLVRGFIPMKRMRRKNASRLLRRGLRVWDLSTARRLRVCEDATPLKMTVQDSAR